MATAAPSTWAVGSDQLIAAVFAQERRKDQSESESKSEVFRYHTLLATLADAVARHGYNAVASSNPPTGTSKLQILNGFTMEPPPGTDALNQLGRMRASTHRFSAGAASPRVAGIASTLTFVGEIPHTRSDCIFALPAAP